MTRRRKKPDTPEQQVGEFAGVRVQFPPRVPPPTMARLCLELRALLDRENLGHRGRFMFIVGGEWSS